MLLICHIFVPFRILFVDSTITDHLFYPVQVHKQAMAKTDIILSEFLPFIFKGTEGNRAHHTFIWEKYTQVYFYKYEKVLVFTNSPLIYIHKSEVFIFIFRWNI